MSSLPFVFDVKRVEKEDETSSLAKRCKPGRHVPEDRNKDNRGFIWTFNKTGKIVVHDTCKLCGGGYYRAPNADEMLLYKEVMRNPFANYKSSAFI